MLWYKTIRTFYLVAECFLSFSVYFFYNIIIIFYSVENGRIIISNSIFNVLVAVYLVNIKMIIDYERVKGE